RYNEITNLLREPCHHAFEQTDANAPMRRSWYKPATQPGAGAWTILLQRTFTTAPVCRSSAATSPTTATSRPLWWLHLVQSPRSRRARNIGNASDVLPKRTYALPRS